jgi:prephenate dehydratase
VAAVRVGFLGPEGTFSDEALHRDAPAAGIERVPLESIYGTVMAVQERSVDRSLVPIENSIEGSVTVTLDTLAGEARDVVIVGEIVLPVTQCLIARSEQPLSSFAYVISHPHASAQCARFLRRELPAARVLDAGSTAEAVRAVAQAAERDRAALGTRYAAQLYGCTVLRDGVEDEPGNETRFVWLAREGEVPDADRTTATKTSLVFWGPGDTGPGWLVSCLDEFARRAINLTKIESRPRRRGLGHYLFFADLEGHVRDPDVAAAIEGLRGHCEEVRLLGSYRAAA